MGIFRKNENLPVTEAETETDTNDTAEAEAKTEEPTESKRRCIHDQRLCSVCKHGIEVERFKVYQTVMACAGYGPYEYICDLEVNISCENFEKKE